MVGFPGIQFIRDKNNNLTMTHTGLIERILSAMDMEDCNHKYTPVKKDPLCKDVDGSQCCNDWDYRSIVVMILYLAGSTRPDIAYALHQCARFSHSPKHSHKIVVKHVARYLKGNQTKGIIMTPDRENLRIDMYAEFAGLYTTEDMIDPVSVNSRSGVMLTFGNVPVLWSSKLQSELSLSTLETDYIALYQGMRDLLSATRLMTELGKRVNYKLDKVSYVSMVWEDNTGTQNLANGKVSLMTSRTKHIGIKYHWFRSVIRDKIKI